MSKYILETNELTKVFGKQKAVNNVSLKINEKREEAARGRSAQKSRIGLPCSGSKDL